MTEYIYDIIKGQKKVVPLTFSDSNGEKLNFESCAFSFAIDVLNESGEIIETIEENSVQAADSEPGKINITFTPEFTSTLKEGVHRFRIKTNFSSPNGDMITITNDPIRVLNG